MNNRGNAKFEISNSLNSEIVVDEKNNDEVINNEVDDSNTDNQKDTKVLVK